MEEHKEFPKTNLMSMSNKKWVVISCGGSYDDRNRVAEQCKTLSLNYVDCGIAHFQGHVQTIYPGVSALFEAIVDYEDLSEDAPHCVTKSFPTNIDHCLLWAMRKVTSWKKEKPRPNENLEQKSREKFIKHFVKKPKTLLETFPPKENPETWKRPKRPPRTDIGLSLSNPLHAKVIQSLMHLYEFRKDNDSNDDDDNDEEVILPTMLENDLLISLTKMRAYTYKIAADLEEDKELVGRARKQQVCNLATSHLATALVIFECLKLEFGLTSNDWWLSEMAGLGIVKSKSTPTYRKIGKNLELSGWDKVIVMANKDWTLQDFLDHMEKNVGVTVEAVIQNGRSIFMKIMPTHVNKKKKS